MKKLMVLILIAVFSFLILSDMNIASASAGIDYDMKPMFHDSKTMSTQELISEMKYAIKSRNEGKYYPQDRINEIEGQMAVNQKNELERYKSQLKKEAEVAKKVDDLKQKAIDKAKEKGEAYYEEHKEEIQTQVEEQARKIMKVSKNDWDDYKGQFNDMYEQGSKAYEEHAQKYVEVAQKAYDAYNAYNKAKADNPEAPEAAQNLVGFLNATKEVLNFAGDKMDGTPLRPVGEILKAYGEAAGLGDTAAKVAWKAIHKEGISAIHNSQYSDGLNQVDLPDYGLINKTSLMNFDKDLRILDLGNGKYAAFDKDFKLISGASGNTLTSEEFARLEKMYVAYSNGKKEDWPKLTTEELVKLARGEKLKVKTKDNWISSDEFKEFDAESIMSLGHREMNNELRDEVYRSIDRIINGEQGIFGKIADPFTKWGRRREISDAYYEYLKTLDTTLGTSTAHQLENFLEYVKKMKEENKDITMKEILEKLKKQAEEKKNQKDKGDEEMDDDADNPLEKELKKIKPDIDKVDSSGIQDKNKTGSNKDDRHWTEKTKDEFNGSQDSGFTRIGTTYRQLPDPNELRIPVLKPNIYLYPAEDEQISVSFSNPGNVTTSIPEYNQSYGWRVFAETDGTLNDKYGFLFYEADVKKIYFQKTKGWKLSVENRVQRMIEILDMYGFNHQEKKDFIEFWDKKLEAGTEYIVYPQGTSIIDRAMPVKIAPAPDSSYRIWFYFIPDNKLSVLEPENVENIFRDGFTVIEWGGMVEP